MPTILRPSRVLFRFSGTDAQKLLFDVVTGRLVEAEGPPVWWALLSPQGKIQAEGQSVWRDGAFWLDVDQSVADGFLKRMKIYRLRAAVSIDDLRESHRVGYDPLVGHVIGTTAEAASLRVLLLSLSMSSPPDLVDFQRRTARDASSMGCQGGAQ